MLNKILNKNNDTFPIKMTNITLKTKQNRHIYN